MKELGKCFTQGYNEEMAAAREAEKSDCAKPEPKTVRLHRLYQDGTPDLDNIMWIKPYNARPPCSVVSKKTASGRREYIVTESPTEITRLARAAWGADWSCPGAEPPCIPLKDTEGRPLYVAKVTRLVPLGNQHCTISGLDPLGFFADRGILRSATDIRAACAKAGVPCVAEESKPAMVTLFDVHGNAVSYTEIFSLRRGLDEECAVTSWVRGRTLEGMVDRTPREIELSPSGIIEVCLSASVPCPPEDPPKPPSIVLHSLHNTEVPISLPSIEGMSWGYSKALSATKVWEGKSLPLSAGTPYFVLVREFPKEIAAKIAEANAKVHSAATCGDT